MDSKEYTCYWMIDYNVVRFRRYNPLGYTFRYYKIG